MSNEVRMVHCRKLGKEMPGMKRQPFRNELGEKLFAEVSQEAWDQWIQKDSVRLLNTYRVDLGTAEGQRFMMEQTAIYFGYKDGELAQTAWTPPAPKG